MFTDDTDLTMESIFAGEEDHRLLPEHLFKKNREDKNSYERIFGVSSVLDRTLRKMFSLSVNHRFWSKEKQVDESYYLESYFRIFGETSPLYAEYDPYYEVMMFGYWCDCCGVKLNLLNCMHNYSLCDSCNFSTFSGNMEL